MLIRQKYLNELYSIAEGFSKYISYIFFFCLTICFRKIRCLSLKEAFAFPKTDLLWTIIMKAFDFLAFSLFVVLVRSSLPFLDPYFLPSLPALMDSILAS
jgi:hypothetical protein